MSKAKHNVVSYSKVDNSKIDFTELEVSDRANGQSNAYVRYKCEKNGERQFDIQTPVIKMDSGGIPDGDMYKTFSSKCMVRIPLEPNPNVRGESEEDYKQRSAKLEVMRKTIQSLDTYMVDNKPALFKNSKNADQDEKQYNKSLAK